jgi:hypothetical protein
MLSLNLQKVLIQIWAFVFKNWIMTKRKSSSGTLFNSITYFVQIFSYIFGDKAWNTWSLRATGLPKFPLG